MEKVITAKPSTSFLNFKEIWQQRELLYFLTLRDISVRYKQTIAGVSWTILNPVLTMVVFTFLFSQIGLIPSSDTPYPIFVFSGLIFWNLFSRSIISASESIVANQNLVKKIAFPRFILPLASIGVHIVDFFSSFVVLLFLMLVFNYRPNLWGFVILPFVLFFTIICAIGLGSFLASINVKYRDVRLLLPFLVQLLFFLTPVIYPLKSINENYRFFLLLNPVAAAVEIFKSTLFNTNSFDMTILLSLIILSLLIFFIGIYKFQYSERYFADIV